MLLNFLIILWLLNRLLKTKMLKPWKWKNRAKQKDINILTIDIEKKGHLKWYERQNIRRGNTLPEMQWYQRTPQIRCCKLHKISTLDITKSMDAMTCPRAKRSCFEWNTISYLTSSVTFCNPLCVFDCILNKTRLLNYEAQFWANPGGVI